MNRSVRIAISTSAIFPTLLCALLASTGCTPPEEALTANSESSTTEITVALASYDDLLSTVAEFKGKVVVVDIWSTSCIPCMREFPHLVELAKTHADNVRCISMNVDYIGLKKKPAEKYVPKVEEFLRKQSATITNFLSSDPDEIILDQFEVGAIPAILIFDTNGDLVVRLTDSNSGEDGLTYEGDVIPAVEELLPQN